MYLLAYVPEYKAVRTFAVDRIASASLEKQTFTSQQAVGDDVFANSLGVNTGPAERVEIEFDARVAPYVRARVWHPSQQIEDVKDGGVSVTLNVCHDWGLRSWILSWGPFARVVSPPRLAKEIHADLEAAGNEYDVIIEHLAQHSSGSSGARSRCVFLAGPSLLRFYTDWLWFGEVGYQQRLLDDASESGHALHASPSSSPRRGWSLNLNVALNAIGNVRPVFTTREGIQVTLPGGRQLRTLALAPSLFFCRRSSASSCLVAGRNGCLAIRRAVRRPIRSSAATSRSTSSHCPSCELVHRLAQTMVVLAALSAGAIYLVSGHLTSGFPARISVSPAARRHL